jgi:uncharacterized protein HemY
MARATTWPQVNEEILSLADFHADCARSIENMLAKSDIKAIPPELLRLQRRSIIKHHEWSILLRTLSKLES